MSQVAIVAGSFVASGLYNVDSNRFRAASLDTRTEGWTECWGAENDDEEKRTDGNQKDGDVDDVEKEMVWKHEKDHIATLLATEYPQLPLVLTQFRPAWFEQLVLRFSGLPHIVINASYPYNESTGPLPYLRDHQPTKCPILVGRQHPSNIAPSYTECQNNILDYLMTDRNIDLDAALTNDQQRAWSGCLMNLIQTELNLLLQYLRYEDADAWEQVYRKQYVVASSLGHRKTWYSPLMGRFQASMERAVARRRFAGMSYHGQMNVQQATKRAEVAYAALQGQLESHDKPFLMGNDKPTLVDAVFWSHLADALGDVHLVVSLSAFPRLLQYFHHIYETYFTGKLDVWDKWNMEQNRTNGFNQIPSSYGNKNDTNNKNDSSRFKNAIDLMQSLSHGQQRLRGVIESAKVQRSAEPWPEHVPVTETLFYKWRMGADLTSSEMKNNKSKSSSDDGNNNNNPIGQKIRRDQERNDQVWISGVGAVSLIALILLQSASNGS